jgi:TolB-like protein/Flp pilus assembly protein TadD
MSFVSELRRRQVFRAAAWYGGCAWIAIEVADTVFPRFGLPDWSVRAVILAALLALPVVLLLAWTFDLSAAGLQRERAAAGSTTASPAAILRMPSLWIALVLGAGLTLSAQQAWRKIVHSSPEARPGIAVLPFVNMSPDPENAYFADGLHEEILSALGRTAQLRVISRTSVEQYRDHQKNLREVADALGVTNILEGSVRREGDEVRVTFQLIDGRTDEQLWTETFDSRLEGILRLQQAVALQVAATLGARLSPTEQRDIEQEGTSVPAAYDQYLHAAALRATATDNSQRRNALRLLGEAIRLDPAFARAYATRGRLLIDLLGSGAGAPGDVDRARADIDRALELQPELPDGLVARAQYATYISLDPAGALTDLSRALAVAPNDPWAHAAMGFTLRRLGRVDEALEHFLQAAALAPGVIEFDGLPGSNYYYAKDYPRAELEARSLAERYPEDSSLRLWAAAVRFLATGDLGTWPEESARLAPTLPPFDLRQLSELLLICTGDLAGLAQRYERTPQDDLLTAKDYMLGVTYTALGDAERAAPHLEAAAAIADTSTETVSQTAFTLAEAAVALELLGRHDDAFHAADQAVRFMPESRDALNGPQASLKRAWVLIHSGDRSEEGYAELERLMGALDIHPRLVAADPLWIILRQDERTQQILRSAIDALERG